MSIRFITLLVILSGLIQADYSQTDKKPQEKELQVFTIAPDNSQTTNK